MNIHTMFSSAVPTVDPLTSTTTRMSGDSNIGAWIQFAKLTAAAGEMAPFPYIKGVAGCIVTILEVVEVRAVKCCCTILTRGLVSWEEQRGPSELGREHRNDNTNHQGNC